MMDQWADTFNKYALGFVAVVSMVIGPWLQWRIAKRQAKLQEDISIRQVTLQESIAKRQVADSIAGRRQTWIDELRADVSKYIVLNEHMADVQSTPRVEGDRGDKEFDAYLSAVREASETSVRIGLRLNGHQETHAFLLLAMQHLHRATRLIDEDDDLEREEEWKQAKRSVIVLTRAILKSEWERVKQGDV